MLTRTINLISELYYYYHKVILVSDKNSAPLDGDRLIRLATELVMFLTRTAIREGKTRPVDVDLLCEREALEYAIHFYDDMLMFKNKGIRFCAAEVRKYCEKLMAETEFP